MQAIDGVFFTGGEDVSPSLFKVPEKEKNEGEEINAHARYLRLHAHGLLP